MATATAPDQAEIERQFRAIAHERYDAAVTTGRLMQDPDGSLTVGRDNSKDFYRWETSVRRIACAMRGDHLSSDDLSAVDAIAASMWGELEDRLLDWLVKSQLSDRR